MSTPDRRLETLVDGGAFFECPRWHDGRLWVSDFWRYRVFAISPDGTTETVAEVPGSPTGLGWLPDGTLLVVSMADRKLLRVADGATVEHADLSAHSAPQCNDMVVDAAGRATSARSTSWPGTRSRPRTSSGPTPTDPSASPPTASASPTAR